MPTRRGSTDLDATVGTATCGFFVAVTTAWTALIARYILTPPPLLSLHSNLPPMMLSPHTWQWLVLKLKFLGVSNQSHHAHNYCLDASRLR
jgi:hypothetical protein